MNLCVICRDVSEHVASGLVRATCELAEALAEEGHEVHLLTDRSRHLPTLRGVSLEPLTVPVASGPFRGARVETARHDLLHAAAATARLGASMSANVPSTRYSRRCGAQRAPCAYSTSDSRRSCRA